MLHRPVARGQPFAHFGGRVIERSNSAAIRNAAALINNVKALGPSGISVIGGVAHVVDAEGQRKLESLRKIIRDRQALLQRFRLRVADVIFIFKIGFHLPFVGGMRFAHVDGQKIGVLLIVLVNLNDVADLAAKGRSSKAPENEN